MTNKKISDEYDCYTLLRDFMRLNNLNARPKPQKVLGLVIILISLVILLFSELVFVSQADQEGALLVKFESKLNDISLIQNGLTELALQQTSQTFYVSKSGDNSAGSSWTTAWNELDQIDWSSISPGEIGRAHV